MPKTDALLNRIQLVVSLALGARVAFRMIQIGLSGGVDDVEPQDWAALVVALMVVALLYLRGWPGRLATWLFLHRAQVAFVIVAAALSAFVLLEPTSRLVIALSSIFVLAIWGWWSIGQAETRGGEERSRQQGVHSIISSKIFLSDSLRAHSVDHTKWKVCSGEPTMIEPTSEGLRVHWETGTSYKKSGQLCAQLPMSEAFNIDAKLLPRRYGAGWDPGIFLYGDEEFPPVLGVGLMPAGHPMQPPPGKAYMQAIQGLAIGLGTPGNLDSVKVVEKAPVLIGRQTQVRIEVEGNNARVSCDGEEVWQGTLSGLPKYVCVGAFRWPWTEDQVGPAGQTAEHLIRDVAVTTITKSV